MSERRHKREQPGSYPRSVYSSRRIRRRTVRRRRLAFLGAVVLMAVIVFVSTQAFGGEDGGSAGPAGQTSLPPASGPDPGSANGSGSQNGSDPANGSGSETETTVKPGIDMQVRAVAETEPDAFDFSTAVFRGNNRMTEFSRSEPISFGPGAEYTDLEGVITFRGNNYREGAGFGTADVELGQLEILWTVPTGSIARSSGGAWTGSGWTGQPLIVRWPQELKRIMNIGPEDRAAPDFTEVIYPCLDGNIYFLDLEDGTKTRNTIVSGGGPFKGTGSIYPKGPPILFVGHGDNAPNKDVVQARLYSLIDQSLLFTFGKKPDPVALRRFHAYDSSPLFDVDTDTIIAPGENGVLYTIRLNTRFDKVAGTLSVGPSEPIKMRYTAPNYKDGSENTPTTRWWGMEGSPVIWRNYLFIGENGGKLMCIDLNTMKPVWIQNVLDDTNSTAVFEESLEDNTGYLYISTSLRITDEAAPTGRVGEIPVWKINAATGEVVWESAAYRCYTIAGVSGGVQGTPILGRHDISDLVIYPIARTPDVNSGLLVALDKETGREVWRTAMPNYAWSSPVAVYTPEGRSYIIQCDSIGTMYLIEGRTGAIIDTLDLGTNIEASPAVFEDTVVVGTRGQKIFGIKIR